jgi:hypothetical protein
MDFLRGSGDWKAIAKVYRNFPWFWTLKYLKEGSAPSGWFLKLSYWVSKYTSGFSLIFPPKFKQTKPLVDGF